MTESQFGFLFFSIIDLMTYGVATYVTYKLLMRL